MQDPPKYVFIVCHVGAEKAVKGEILREWPGMRFAFSRPGFLTFRLPEDHGLSPDFDLKSVFARAHGFSLGKVSNETDAEILAARAWELLGKQTVRRVHVWQRDTMEAGQAESEPALTPLAFDLHRAIRKCCPRREMLAAEDVNLDEPATRGQWVLDCCVVEPDEWWIGYHRVRGFSSQWPGGILPLNLPEAAVSRAWLKMEEALRWSQFPIKKGARCVELGSAPGGASQALLARGALVTGVDPAEMHPSVAEHPNFTHIRRKAIAVRRREYRKARWLTADMNVAPVYTLDCVEEIVTHPEVNIRGLLLTLKLPQWKLASEVPEYVSRVRGWGYNIVHARQLQSNRQEICVAALQRPFRPGRGASGQTDRRTSRKPSPKEKDTAFGNS